MITILRRASALLAVLPLLTCAQVPTPDNPNAGLPGERRAPTPAELGTLSAGDYPKVTIKTSQGEIKLELDAKLAPETVMNFLRYVDDGFYGGTIFHRVIKNFMIQGGGLTADLKQKPTRQPVKNEAANGLRNTRGTVAMARTADIDSATAQFFINTVNNPFLDHQGASPDKFGYCVFGKVVEGMDVVDAIQASPTGTAGGMQDVPTSPITILEITRE